MKNIFTIFLYAFLIYSIFGSIVAANSDSEKLIEWTGSFIPGIPENKNPTVNNLCIYDDQISNREALEKCFKSETIAIDFANRFENILAQGQESKRNRLIKKLNELGNLQNGYKKYLYLRIASEIEFQGYVIHSLANCSDFNGILSDSEGITFKIFKKDQKCNINKIQSYGSMYLESQYSIELGSFNKKIINPNPYDTNINLISSLIYFLNEGANNNDPSIVTKQLINQKLQSYKIEEIKITKILVNYSTLLQLETSIQSYKLINGNLPETITQNDFKDYIYELPVNKLSSSICGKVKYEDLYFIDSSKQNYLLISPTLKISDIDTDYFNGSNNYFIGDPEIFFNDCKSVNWNMLNKTNDGSYEYEKYSCAKDTSKCKPKDYITAISTSK